MRRRHHEEHVNHEAWAIPFGDLLTLLLAFFVVMYAMSSVNEGKYRILADALNAEFRGAPRAPTPIQVGNKPSGQSSEDEAIDKAAMLHGVDGQLAESPSVTEPQAAAETNQATQQEITPKPTTPHEDVAGNAEELNRVADDVENAMSNLIREQLVAVRRHGLWIEVEIQSDILFPSGVAALSPFAMSTLSPLADALKPFPNPLRVEGHTDNLPISTREFPSNWELSSARAASVVHLFSKRGVDPRRLTVIGLGEYRPIKSNATAEGRNANRRVVLVILGSDGLPQGTYGHTGESAVPGP
jgi:chemotaxis protein MotB